MFQESDNKIEQPIEIITVKYEADETDNSRHSSPSFSCESSENISSNAIQDEDQNEDDDNDDNISIIEQELIPDDCDVDNCIIDNCIVDNCIDDKLEDIFETIRQLYKQFSSPESEQGLDEFFTRLNRIKSTDQFNKFLYHDLQISYNTVVVIR